MNHLNASVDKEYEAIKVAKEITIARLSSLSGNSHDGETGQRIGQMYTEILKAVRESFEMTK